MELQGVTLARHRIGGDPAYRPGAAAAYCGFSRTTLWRLRAKGRFPEPFQLTDGAVAWRQSTLDRWLDGREGKA